MRASEKAYSALRRDIIEWRLAPGTVLAEVEQSERLGVSRTPLREALGRLAAEGLIAERGRGVVVTDISLADIDELFELREVLEGEAAGLAAVRGEPKLFQELLTDLLAAPALIHGGSPAVEDYYDLVGRLDRAIDSAISNAYLAQAMRGLRVHLVRIRRLAADDPVRLVAAAAEHAAIAEAIALGNPRLAEALPISRQPTLPLRRSIMVKEHHVRVYKSEESLPREDQLAYKIAVVAADPVEVEPLVAEMVINRIIDNASVAIASLNRAPIVAARAQALAHAPSTGGKGAKVFGIGEHVSPEWAAWANGVAVRELDYHDTFLAAEYSHPGDNIPPILAVAQHVGASGKDLIRGIATGYEIQVNLVKAICLHKHKIDHVAHLGPSAAAGIGTLLGLDLETIFQSVGQGLHTTTATRQSRKGEISTWKAHAPAFAGKMAVEAADRAIRGQTSPVPIYEGEDGVIAWLLDGPGASYHVPLPTPGEAKRAILDTYTKEHSAEYQAQALIDLARKLHGEYPELKDADNVASIVIKTSNHTHYVIGSGANDPQKYDPTASRETLDHSIPYIFTVALQDGTWHHVDSYTPERAARPDTVALWHKVITEEDPEWTRRYHALDINEKAFGGSVEITLTDGTVITDEIAVADAHPLGARPFARQQYINKFRTLAAGLVEEAEIERFLTAVERLPELGAGELDQLNITAAPGVIDLAAAPKGLF